VEAGDYTETADESAIGGVCEGGRERVTRTGWVEKEAEEEETKYRPGGYSDKGREVGVRVRPRELAPRGWNPIPSIQPLSTSCFALPSSLFCSLSSLALSLSPMLRSSSLLFLLL